MFLLSGPVYSFNLRVPLNQPAERMQDTQDKLSLRAKKESKRKYPTKESVETEKKIRNDKGLPNNPGALLTGKDKDPALWDSARKFGVKLPHKVRKYPDKALVKVELKSKLQPQLDLRALEERNNSGLSNDPQILENKTLKEVLLIRHNLLRFLEQEEMLDYLKTVDIVSCIDPEGIIPKNEVMRLINEGKASIARRVEDGERVVVLFYRTEIAPKTDFIDYKDVINIYNIPKRKRPVIEREDLDYQVMWLEDFLGILDKRTKKKILELIEIINDPEDIRVPAALAALKLKEKDYHKSKKYHGRISIVLGLELRISEEKSLTAKELMRGKHRDNALYEDCLKFGIRLPKEPHNSQVKTVEKLPVSEEGNPIETTYTVKKLFLRRKEKPIRTTHTEESARKEFERRDKLNLPSDMGSLTTGPHVDSNLAKANIIYKIRGLNPVSKDAQTSL